MNRLLRKLARHVGFPDHQCGGFPWCPECLPPAPPTTPVDVRIATVVVLRAHGPDPLARRCICGFETSAYYDHVVEQLVTAGVLRTDRDLT